MVVLTTQKHRNTKAVSYKTANHTYQLYLATHLCWRHQQGSVLKERNATALRLSKHAMSAND